MPKTLQNNIRRARFEHNEMTQQELEHIRRRDWLTLCIARLVCTFYWFHPLVWMSCRHLCLEAERACDDAVLRDSDALGYADQLVDLAQRLAKPSGGPVLAMANRGDLSARVNAVLDPHRPRSRTETTWLAMSRITAAVLAFTLAPLQAVVTAKAQGPTAAAKPITFEVASVKTNKGGDAGSTFQLQPGGGFRAVNMRLRDLIAMAYGPPPLPDFQITGGPKWMDTDRFDVVAKADHEWQAGPNGPPPQLFLMLQSLLTERFHLGVHRETKEIPICALIRTRSDGKLGSRLHPSTTDCAALMAAMRARGGPPAPLKAGERPACSARMLPGNFSGSSVTMAELTNALSGFVSRTVVDRSRLTGGYDVDLEWTPDQMPQGRGTLPEAAALPPVAPNGPSLFTALQEQLGLKLESTRGPVSVLVIDRAEPPTKD